MPQQHLPALWPTLMLTLLILRDICDYHQKSRTKIQINENAENSKNSNFPIFAESEDNLANLWPLMGASAASTFILDQIVHQDAVSPSDRQTTLGTSRPRQPYYNAQLQGIPQQSHATQPDVSPFNTHQQPPNSAPLIRDTPLLLYPSTTVPPSDWGDFIIPDPPKVIPAFPPSNGRVNNHNVPYPTRTNHRPSSLDHPNNRPRINTLHPSSSDKSRLLPDHDENHNRKHNVYTKTRPVGGKGHFGAHSKPQLPHLGNDVILTSEVTYANDEDGLIIRDGTHVEPDTINCYSCMSKYYEANWPILQNIYNKPMNFTDDCDFHASRPNAQAGVGLVKCDSVCIKMYEQSQIGGLYVNGFTRGCYDNMMRRGFNATLVKWYRWLQRDSCHEYSRRQILQLGPQAPDGVVTICTCYADGCNGSPRLSAAAGVQALIRWSTCLGIGLYVIYFSHMYWL